MTVRRVNRGNTVFFTFTFLDENGDVAVCQSAELQLTYPADQGDFRHREDQPHLVRRQLDRSVGVDRRIADDPAYSAGVKAFLATLPWASLDSDALFAPVAA